MPSAYSDLPFNVERHADEIIVDLSARKVLDEAAVQELREPLVTLAHEASTAHWNLDLKGIEYITSSMLETLIQVHRVLKDGGGRLTLLHLQPQVHEVFEVTKLHELFEIRKGNG
jgi:anti-anti-sigma factor